MKKTPAQRKQHSGGGPPLSHPGEHDGMRARYVKRQIIIFLGLFMLAATGFFIIRGMQIRQGIPLKAGTNTAKISVKPAGATMPPDTNFQVWVTADNPVVFVTAKITFDPKKVKLNREITTTTSPLTRVIRQTAMSEANATGIINLSLGLDPTKRSTPPAGAFELAVIPLTPNTATKNVSMSLQTDVSAVQVVGADFSLFTVKAEDTVITLNPPPTPTQTPAPGSTTPTATPTSTPSATPTSTPSGTLIPTPGMTETPAAEPTGTITPAGVTGASVTDIQITGVTLSEATLSWETSANTSDWLTYGESENSMNQQTRQELFTDTSHTVTLTNLTGGSTYYYQIFSQDESGTVTFTPVKQFRTKNVISNFFYQMYMFFLGLMGK